jgi:hypothetical protein
VTIEDLLTSVAQDPEPPQGLSAPLRALWLTKKDRWEEAHDVVNDLPTAMGSWIHAHLHRIEGDLGNAAYWYARAGRPTLRSRENLEAEWRDLVLANL